MEKIKSFLDYLEYIEMTIVFLPDCLRLWKEAQLLSKPYWNSGVGGSMEILTFLNENSIINIKGIHNK